MEKYGVDTTRPDGEKTANEEQKCPICGSALDPDSAVPRCPSHGTKPFEKGREG